MIAKPTNPSQKVDIETLAAGLHSDFDAHFSFVAQVELPA